MATGVAGLLVVVLTGSAAGQDPPAPIVDAGPDQTIVAPGVASLDGTVTSDQLVTVRWTVVSGPGSVEFVDANAEDTQAAMATIGTYVLRLNVSDGIAAARDEVTITVVAANDPPFVSAGPDLAIAIDDAARLDGSAGDDGRPSPLSIAWSVVAGPGTVTMPDATAIRTSARFGAPGTYVLRVTATDGASEAVDEVTVTVTAANAPPTVSAGPSRTITLPAPVQLAGTANDDGQPESPGTLTLAWSVVRGPGAVTFLAPDSAQTSARFAVAGSYLLRLTAFDGAVKVHDEVTVTVAPPPADTALLAAYGFDEGAGTTVPDRTGHGPPLTRHGATWIPGGRHGGAMAFDGVKNRLEGAPLLLPATFTVMAWTLDTSPLPLETVLSIGPERTLKLAGGDVLFTTPNGDVRFGPTGAPDAWHHVAVTSDGETLRAFVDGAPTGAPQPVAVGAAEGPLHVGAWPLGAPVDFFGGALDDVRVYGRALSAAEIARDMRTPIGGASRADTDAPRVTLDAPAGGEVLSEVVTLTASASDDVGVSAVRFVLDGEPLGGEVSAPPYWMTWDTRTAANGPHRLQVTARDAAGNRSTTPARPVTVTNPRPAEDNRPPAVSAGVDLSLARPGPALLEGTASDDGRPSPGTLTITWSVESGPGDVRFDTPDGARTVVHFAAVGVYVLRLTATDGALTASDVVVVTVGPSGPPAPP
ncbi:MAG: PKD domain-containing protein [Vicinamibacterales bacterium]